MVAVILFVLSALLPVLQYAQDPAPGLTRSVSEVRNMDCTRMTQEGAAERYPGLIGETPARGGFIQNS